MTKLHLTFSVILLLATVSLFSQDTIPNRDFEGWITSTNPKHWQTTTGLLPPGYVTSMRTSNSVTGDYAMKLVTIDIDSMPVPGVICLGTIGMGFTEGGIPFTGKPESLKGYFMHPSIGDIVMAVAQFYKNGIEIGGGYWSTIDSVGAYTEFVMPISFQSPEAPDTLNITILTDQQIIGSMLYLDALHFEYTTTAVEERPTDTGLEVYPNPCSDRLFMNVPGEGPYTASIFSLNGKEMATAAHGEDHSINTSRLTPGAYVLSVRTQDRIFKNTIIKQ